MVHIDKIRHIKEMSTGGNAAFSVRHPLTARNPRATPPQAALSSSGTSTAPGNSVWLLRVLHFPHLSLFAMCRTPCIRQEPYRPKLAATCLMGSCWPCAPGRFAALKERCAAWEFYHEDYAYNHFPAITGRLYGLSAGGGVWALMPDAGQGVGDRFPSFSRWRWRPILLAFGSSHVLQ